MYVSLRRIFSRKSVARGATPFLPKRPLPPQKKQTAPARGEAPIGLSILKDLKCVRPSGPSGPVRPSLLSSHVRVLV